MQPNLTAPLISLRAPTRLAREVRLRSYRIPRFLGYSLDAAPRAADDLPSLSYIGQIAPDQPSEALGTVVQAVVATDGLDAQDSHWWSS